MDPETKKDIKVMGAIVFAILCYMSLQIFFLWGHNSDNLAAEEDREKYYIQDSKTSDDVKAVKPAADVSDPD